MEETTRLAAFAGYYAIDAAPGAFVSIDAVEQHFADPAIAIITEITISVSLDGTSVSSQVFGPGNSFDGQTLTIPGVMNIVLLREYSAGTLVSLTGTYGSIAITGGTFFNPVPLNAFAGKYYLDSNLVLNVRGGASIIFDYGIFSGTPGQLTLVPACSYTVSMFVLMFKDTVNAGGQPFTLMLGTAGLYGLACSIQGSGHTVMALSIPPAA